MKYLLLIICFLFTLNGCIDFDVDHSLDDVQDIKDDIIDYYEYDLMINNLELLSIKKQNIVLDDFAYKQDDVYNDMSDKGLVYHIQHLEAVEDQFEIMLEIYSDVLRSDILYFKNSLATLEKKQITEYDINSICNKVKINFSNFIHDDILPDYNYFNSEDLSNFHENLHIILDDNELIFNNN